MHVNVPMRYVHAQHNDDGHDFLNKEGKPTYTKMATTKKIHTWEHNVKKVCACKKRLQVMYRHRCLCSLRK